MEDDDEFGDLYTDVLRPFASSSSSAPQAQPSSAAPQSSSRPIDLNLNTDDDEILCAAPHSNSAAPRHSIDQTKVPSHRDAVQESLPAAAAPNLIEMNEQRAEKEEESAEAARFTRLGVVELTDRSLQDLNRGRESAIDDSRNEVGVKGVDLLDKDVKFDIEEDGNGIEDVDSEPIIPGLSTDAGGGDGGGSVFVDATGAEASRKVDESGDRGEGDDWDSDSDDDLQIVLNDNNHMAMERGGMVGDDDDEDEDGLVIVADGDPNQAAEEQDWGEDTAQPTDGERKDTGESAKTTGGMAVAPKVGYSNHGYHPFHSQFKYVRPGAAPLPGGSTALGGPPGQIRPVTNMGPMAGRGRGDWRPAGMKGGPVMQKGFHSGPGMPVWGNSAAGRGFGGGLEFTLPSHKTIFDVDIDSFEEKPWNYPGVDASDFFNFGMNEESWKDYCKQLEQLRLESTMQSKIRVYESGRAEQEYDPDLPPELAAATGIHNVLVENTNFVKSDVGQSDLTKGSGRVRPPLPTGRAIQVEGGYGERLPSIDTRPPRIRDSDAIIEIVLQDSADDDSSTGIGGQDQSKGEPQREDFRENHVVGSDIPRVENEYDDGYEQDYNGPKRELVGRRMSYMNSSPGDVPEGDEALPYPQEDDYPGSRVQTPGYSGGNCGSSYDERRMKGRANDRSPHVTPRRQMAVVDNQKEESIESMGDRHSAHLSSKPARECSVEDKDAELDETGMVDGSSRMEKEEMDLDPADNTDSLQDGELKGEKLTSQVEQPPLDEVDDWEDSKAARSSDNSKARSASSKDYQKRRDGFEEEVIQDARSARLGSIRRNLDENEQGLRRREHEGRQELERKRMVPKGREKPYPYKDRHASSSHQLHTNIDGFERIKDRDNSSTAWARRDDDTYGRRVRDRDDESRKRDRGKVRENERSDKGDSLHLRKQLDNGGYRVPHDKDVGSRDSRHREGDDGFKSRSETMEDYNSKRRKDEEYLRREHAEKEEIPHGYRENASRRRRERDEVLDPRKRDDLQRSRDSLEDHYALRQKDEVWLLRERGDKQREREEWHRVKQSHEEHPSKRESKEGRGTVRGGRGTEDKAWVGHARAKDEQKVSDKEYQSREQSKRRDRIQDGSIHQKVRDDAYARGNQYNGEERRSRQERSSSRGDRVSNAADNLKVHERKHKESTRKSKESDVSDHDNLVLSKRNQEDQSGQINEKSLKDTGDEGRGAEHDIPGHRLSRKHREDISSDEEQQDSYRGRSKLERWTSHKERDFIISSKTSSSLKFKDIDKDNNDGSSEAGKPLDESTKTVDAIDNHHLSSAEGKDSIDIEGKDADSKIGDRHLDTVEKLKKRSERFKLPMPSEKEALAIKKMESEPLPSAKSENPVEPEVKQERPARKRRWISS